MGRFDRALYFEALCRLQALYRLRSDADSTAVMSVEDAVGYACELLAEAEGSASEDVGDLPSAQAGR
jgi:hypothetical protein